LHQPAASASLPGQFAEMAFRINTPIGTGTAHAGLVPGAVSLPLDETAGSASLRRIPVLLTGPGAMVLFELPSLIVFGPSVGGRK
jgi:hypothetical protein